jgi:hypothetical protein
MSGGASNGSVTRGQTVARLNASMRRLRFIARLTEHARRRFLYGPHGGRPKQVGSWNRDEAPDHAHGFDATPPWYASHGRWMGGVRRDASDSAHRQHQPHRSKGRVARSVMATDGATREAARGVRSQARPQAVRLTAVRTRRESPAESSDAFPHTPGPRGGFRGGSRGGPKGDPKSGAWWRSARARWWRWWWRLQKPLRGCSAHAGDCAFRAVMIFCVCVCMCVCMCKCIAWCIAAALHCRLCTASRPRTLSRILSPISARTAWCCAWLVPSSFVSKQSQRRVVKRVAAAGGQACRVQAQAERVRHSR